ncbi:MAG TPA: GyrI-like domain-containing protein [Spirochaetia bacterium]|nr:GyrI-like domain-containing protein [Spirochaetales bacterium]HRY81443.1 GyrI-like domain-containing protein [Spirochaetia bacterium]HRZ90067.1 GyrI-like domain-containing protein [Spirochaetia bacterium]
MEILRKKEQPALSIRYRTAAAKLPETMGPVFGQIAAYMARKGIPFAGPPFAMYHNMDMEDLDVEIGFPVGKAEPGEGRIKSGRLPGGPTATAKHTGPYTTIETTYNTLMAFVAEKGVTPESFMYEEYLNSPEDTPVEKLETNIYFPLKG